MVFAADPDSLMVTKITEKINEELQVNENDSNFLTENQFEQIINKIRFTNKDKTEIIYLLEKLGKVRRVNRDKIIIL